MKVIKALFLLICILLCGVGYAEEQLKGVWVDSFHPGVSTRSDVSVLAAELQRLNANSVFPEVRKRGDVYYKSAYEPQAADVEADYDPLADLIEKAHASKKRPIEVHAWMVMYPVWRGADGVPTQPNHPYRLHPEWFDRTKQGETFDGKDYSFDPGHPEVQIYLLNVVMDVVTNYDIDGLSLDYIHYPGYNWGYNSNSVARFNRLYNRNGVPVSQDPEWMQFRRDQVSALVRKIYLSVLDVKPRVKVSTASITWGNAPKDLDDWHRKSAAYNNTFQDWCSWTKEGIVDINIPMVYGPAESFAYTETFDAWCRFAKSQKYNRHLVISPALYLNTPYGSAAQVRAAFNSAGGVTDGVCLYSYASYSKKPAGREELIDEFTKRKGPKGEPPVLGKYVSTPDLPWKLKPKTGHVKGVVLGTDGKEVDGASITITGAKNVSTKSDATGFYGAVDLPPGEYKIEASFAGQPEAEVRTTVTKRKVQTVDMVL